ncbi:Fork-head transcriptional regulator 2 [Candida parapsilosis]|nr:Fork-head transcriptional regulator 2 [Candida parapsilosis]CAD1813343.1 unnamed protein product [Candida parapsilosis]
MASSTDAPSRKRSVNNNSGLLFEDEQDMLSAVISTLQCPEEKTTVSQTYANGLNNATEVQAYAKIAGRDWTYYVKSLAVSIGRNTEVSGNNNNNDNNNNGSVTNTYNGPLIDIDLGPAKIVSRQHATITYNLDWRCWELKVLGRNGAKIDGQKINGGSQKLNALHSGAILDVGGTQMMFILPDAAPVVAPKMLEKALAKYNEQNKDQIKRQRSYNGASYNGGGGGSGGNRGYHVYETISMNHSPSSASATSLQHNLDEDLSKEESKDIKPPYSYATMITQAILSDPHGVMSLSDIYNWISDRYAYYRFSKTGWQNSIRHNLSLNKAFEKVPRKPNEPGKGMKWQISESYKQDFLKKLNDGTLAGSRKGSSVSRQLSLHLATHKHLPDPNNPCLDVTNNQFQQRNSIDQGQQQQGSYSHQRSDSKAFNFNNMQTNPLQYPGQQDPYIPTAGRPYPYPPPPPPPNHPQQQQQQLQLQQNPQNQHPQSTMYPQQQQIPNYPIVGAINNLASPLRQPQQLNQQLPPPSQQSQPLREGAKNHTNSMYGISLQNSGLDVKPNLHSRTSSYTTSNQLPDLSQMHSFASNQNDSLSSIAASTENTTSGMLSFTSPKKISALEAYTPERGSNKNAVGNKPVKRESQQSQEHQSQQSQQSQQQSQQQQSSQQSTQQQPQSQSQQQPPQLQPPVQNSNQTSPAFWNFVQFSTPNGQTPTRKDSNDSDEQNNGSPTMNRKSHKNVKQEPEEDSPFKKEHDQQAAGMVDS